MNRRTAVEILGSLALGSVAAGWGRHALAQPVCTLTPEQIEGPFYLDKALVREVISEGKPGVPLQLILHVLDTSASCAPIPRVAVDVWQCDALGIYSGYEGVAIAPRHIEPVHDKLRVGAKVATTQLYFPDEVTNAVYARAPYDRHPNRDTTNATDRFLKPVADKSLVMWTMARDGEGYIAAATVALRTS